MPSVPLPLLSGNLLLDALRPADRALLLPYLEHKEYERGEVLFDVGDEVSSIAFPCQRSVAALLITMKDGRAVETATVGREGAIGGVVSQGALPAFSRAVVQIAGPVLHIEAERLQELKRTSPALRNLFTRYSDCLLAQVLQSVACNALHPIEARCARWLLSLQDRLGGDVLPITHEVLAELLGVQRSYLTRTLKILQQQGLIRAGRGRIIICSRPEMEAAACECHRAIKRHFGTVLGAVYSANGALLTLHPEAASEKSLCRAV
jgi:CRP-like cAMP-binding protein